MIYMLLAAALIPGIITAIRLRHRGWPLAVAAGLGVTCSIPFVALSCLIVFPPLGFAVGLFAAASALTAYDDGRIWTATLWGSVAVIALGCVGWSL